MIEGIQIKPIWAMFASYFGKPWPPDVDPYPPVNIKSDDLKNHIHKLFSILLRDHNYHPLALDQLLLSNRLTKYEIPLKKIYFQHRWKGKRFLYKFSIIKINPPQPCSTNKINYTIEISGGLSGKLLGTEATVILSHKPSLQSRAMSILLVNTNRLEQMQWIVDFTRRNFHKFDTNKCKLCYFNPLMISPRNLFYWKLLMIAKSRAAVLPVSVRSAEVTQVNNNNNNNNNNK